MVFDEGFAVTACWAQAIRDTPTEAATAPATDVPTKVRRSITCVESGSSRELDGIDVEGRCGSGLYFRSTRCDIGGPVAA
jgi:hypothetical protein